MCDDMDTSVDTSDSGDSSFDSVSDDSFSDDSTDFDDVDEDVSDEDYDEESYDDTVDSDDIDEDVSDEDYVDEDYGDTDDSDEIDEDVSDEEDENEEYEDDDVSDTLDEDLSDEELSEDDDVTPDEETADDDDVETEENPETEEDGTDEEFSEDEDVTPDDETSDKDDIESKENPETEDDSTNKEFLENNDVNSNEDVTEGNDDSDNNSDVSQENGNKDDNDINSNSGNNSEFNNYDYEISPETLDANNPEKNGEFVSANNPYRDRWEDFGEEFADDGKANDWDSLKDVPFAGDSSNTVDYDDSRHGVITDDLANDDSNQGDVKDIHSKTPYEQLSDYMSKHNYGSGDFSEYSQDPEWRELQRQAFPDYEMPPISKENAFNQLGKYMSDNGYGPDDFATYSQDPKWRELQSFAYPDYQLPPLSQDNNLAVNELEEGYDIKDISDIEKWIGDINPNFDEFDPESPYSNNCGSCAWSVYNRLNGNTDMCATADNIGYNNEMNALTGMEQTPMNPSEIEQRLLSEGNGSHAIIGVDRAMGPGHWFNAVCVNNKVYALDGQTGQINDWPPNYGNVVNWEMSVKKGAN